MPQMARKPFMGTTMGQPGGCRQDHPEAISAMNSPRRAWLIIIKVLSLSNGGTLSSTGAVCDPDQRFWPARSSSPRRRRRPRAGFSSSPTRRTGMASTSASPRAKNAVPMRRCPIAGRGILRRPHPTGASTRTKSRDRYPRPPAVAATTPVAINTSPSPANAEAACCRKNQGFSCHTGAPETT
jgi:hypothetical protein